MSSSKNSAKITPLTRQTLKGAWAALIVPWTDRDELDARRFAKEVSSYGGTGVSGLYSGVLGMRPRPSRGGLPSSSSPPL